LATQKKIVKIL